MTYPWTQGHCSLFPDPEESGVGKAVAGIGVKPINFERRAGLAAPLYTDDENNPVKSERPHSNRVVKTERSPFRFVFREFRCR